VLVLHERKSRVTLAARLAGKTAAVKDPRRVEHVDTRAPQW
jgi:hypothetical protein